MRCGRCDDPICPQCMVSSPVGARCPSCARIGRPAILDASRNEMGRAIGFGLGVAVAGALIFSVILKILVSLPFIIGLIDFIVVAGGIVGLGYAIGEAVRIGSGGKLDKNLKYAVAFAVFIGWAATAAFLPLFAVSANFVLGFNGIIGLVVAFYVGMSRVRSV